MKKRRWLGWILSIAMLIGMLPMEALAAPTTAEGTAISQYVDFYAGQPAGSNPQYALKVQVCQDAAELAAQTYYFNQNEWGAGTVIVSAKDGYVVDSMILTPQNKDSGDAAAFQNSTTLYLTEGIPRTLVINIKTAATFDPKQSTIQNWRRSIEVNRNDSQVGNPAVEGVPGHTDTKAMLHWTWDDVKDIGTDVSDPKLVWDAGYFDPYNNSYLNGKPTTYPAATWNLGTKGPSLRRFTGEYTIPEGLSTRDTYRLRTVNQESTDAGILPINDDIFIFVYQQGETLTNDNFMDYLAFWSGTSTRNGFGDVYSNGRKGTIAYRKAPGPALTNQWYCEANIDNIGTVMYNNYREQGEGTVFTVDIFCFDNSGGGGMEMPTIDGVKATQYAATIRYWKDEVTATSDTDHYLGADSIKGLKQNESVTLDSKQLDAYKPTVGLYGSGVQLLSPYKVEQEDGVINVVYTSTAATVQYHLNLPEGVTASAGVTAPASDTAEQNSVYTIPSAKSEPSGLTNHFFVNGNLRYTFAGWAATTASETAVKSVTVMANPTTLYGIWTSAPNTVSVPVKYYKGSPATANELEPKNIKLENVTLDAVYSIPEAIKDGGVLPKAEKHFYDKEHPALSVTRGTETIALTAETKIQAGDTVNIVYPPANGTLRVWQYYPENRDAYGNYLENYNASLPHDSNLRYTNGTAKAALDVAAVNEILTKARAEMQQQYPGAKIKSVYLDQENYNDAGDKTWVNAQLAKLDPTGKVIEFSALGTQKIVGGCETRLTFSYSLPRTVNVEYWKADDGENYTKVSDGYTIGQAPNYIYTADRLPVSETAGTDSKTIYKVAPTGAVGCQVTGMKLGTPAGGDATVSQDGTYKVPSAGATICVLLEKDPAQWYTVVYKANNGTEQADQTTEAILKGTDHTVKTNTFTSTGYLFVKWTTNADGTGDVGQTVTVPMGDTITNIDLYANWKADVTFTVQNGSFTDTPVTAYTAPATENVSFPTGAPAVGYTAESAKWYVKPVDTAAFIPLASTENIKPVDGTEYELRYERKTPVTVTFDANGHGTFAAGTKAVDKTGSYGETISTVVGAPAPTLTTVAEGWVFTGWYASADLAVSNGQLDLGDAAPLTQNETYYAHYNPKVTYAVGAHGTLTDGNDVAATVPYGGNAALRAVMAKDGYGFSGWYEGDVKFDFTAAITMPKTLTAKYNRLTVDKILTDIMTPSIDPANPMAPIWISKVTGGTPIGEVTASALDKLVYTVTVTNEGDLGYTGLSLSDTLQVNGIPVDADKVTLTSTDDPALILTDFAVSAGASATFKAEYVVTMGDAGQPIINTATAVTPDLDDQDPTDSTDPITPAYTPGMTVEKTQQIIRNGEHNTLRIGDQVLYAITVANTGNQKLTDVQLADDMFAKAIAELKLDGAPATLTGDILIIGEIPVGGKAAVTYTYTITDGDEGKTVKNTAVASSQEGPQAEDKTETDPVEGKTDVKLYYAFEQIEGGSATTFPFATTPISVVRKYPGDTVTRAEFEQAIKAHITLPVGVTETGSKFNRRGEAVADKIADSYVISEETGMNDFAIKYPLQRHTVIYHPGKNGALALGEGAEGELVNGSAVFTVPYGAVPAQWFTGDNGTLRLDKTANEGYVFNGWDTAIDLSAAVRSDLASTAQWRARTAADRDYTVIVYQNEAEIDRRDDFALTYVPGDDAANATLTLDAAALLAEEQVRGKASQGYRFGRYTATGETGDITNKTHTFTITDGAVIRVYYVPYDLTVWHQLSDAQPRFDEAQSIATLTASATANADPNFFGLSRVRYQDTAVAINSIPDTAQTYTEAVTVPLGGGSYAVTFQYYRRSTSGGGNGGNGGNGNGGDSGYQTIEDEEIPLAPGLNAEDHFAYVIGYPDGTVRPNANIDRQEVATIFFRLMQDDSRTQNWSQTNSFRDVQPSQWSNNAISTMAAAGILTGYEDGAFRPSAPITRGEFAAVAARFDSALYVGNDMFSDISGHWAAPYINRAAQKGWIKGYEDGTFKPDQYITRAEAMTLVNAVLDRRVHAENVLAAAVSWPDNPKDAWHYEAVQEATNSHNYDRETPTQYETWTELAQARDWTQLEKQWSAAAAPFGA